MKALRELFRIRGTIPLPLAIVLGVVPLAVIGAAWWYVTRGAAEFRIIDRNTLPSPLEVFGQIPDLVRRGSLLAAILASFRRVAVGFAIGAAAALPLGIAMGSLGSIKAMFQPIAVAAGYLPIAALAPLTMSWFGTNELQKYMFLALASFVYVLPLTIKAMDKVDDVFVQTAYTLGAKRRHVIFKVLVPVAFFEIWQAMRLAFGVGWTYIIFAEIIMSDAGLGQIVIIAQRRGPRENIYLVIIVIALLAFLTDRLWGLAGRFLFPYKRGASS